MQWSTNNGCREFIPIEPVSEVDRFIMQASEQDIVTVSHGMRFRIHPVPEEDFDSNYDPDRFRESILGTSGLLKGLDVEEFKKEILEERRQNSIGRPE